MSIKHLYTNHVDTFVAATLEDVPALYKEYYGATMEESAGDDEFEQWGQIDDYEMKAIFWGGIPKGLRFLTAYEKPSHYDGCTHEITATAREWARWAPPGFLCSTEG